MNIWVLYLSFADFSSEQGRMDSMFLYVSQSSTCDKETQSHGHIRSLYLPAFQYFIVSLFIIIFM